MVSTHLKGIRQNGNLLQVGVNIKHIWNHHLDDNTAGLKFQAPEAYDIHRNPTTSPSSISAPGFCPRPEAPLLFPRIQEIGSPEREFVGVEMVLLGGSSQWTCLITMVTVSPLRSGLFQMAFSWHINGGDPNYLIIGMALQEFGVEINAALDSREVLGGECWTPNRRPWGMPAANCNTWDMKPPNEITAASILKKSCK